MEYIYPDKLKLQTEYLKKYGEEFLRLNNLSIGDNVIMDFPYEYVRSKYKSRELEKFSGTQKLEGIIKINNDGVIYAESIKDVDFHVSTSNGRSGRSYKSWYVLTKRKSIIKLGTGFIF